MEHPIELIMVISFFIISLSMTLRTEDWCEWLIGFKENDTTPILIVGFFNLIIGSFIVAFHYNWQGIAIIVTLIGILMIIRSIVFLLLPRLASKVIIGTRAYHVSLLKLSGISLIIIANIILYHLWSIGFLE